MSNTNPAMRFPDLTFEVGQTVELHYEAGNSDKRYFVAIGKQADGLFSVVALYGRSGGPHNTAIKLTGASYGAANACKAKLVREKQAKGYREVSAELTSATTAPSTLGGQSKAVGADGIGVELLTAVNDVDDLFRTLEARGETALHLQRKLDGVRFVLRGTSSTAGAFSRALRPMTLTEEMKRVATGIIRNLAVTEAVLDCEYLNDRVWIFDWYSMKDDETPPTFADRAIQLKEAHKPLRETRYIDVVPVTTVDASEKYLVEEYIERAMNDGAEGIVVRPESHRRVNGRNPLAMKLKFTATADVVLSSAKGRSMEMHVTDAANKRLAIGRVTIPSNHALPASGSVAEVRYLYRAPGAPLQQPVFLRLRDDLTEADCLDGKITRYKDAPVLSKAYLGHAKSIAQRSGSNNLLW